MYEMLKLHCQFLGDDKKNVWSYCSLYNRPAVIKVSLNFSN